jgi:hypothetical protein
VPCHIIVQATTNPYTLPTQHHPHYAARDLLLRRDVPSFHAVEASHAAAGHSMFATGLHAGDPFGGLHDPMQGMTGARLAGMAAADWSGHQMSATNQMYSSPYMNGMGMAHQGAFFRYMRNPIKQEVTCLWIDPDQTVTKEALQQTFRHHARNCDSYHSRTRRWTRDCQSCLLLGQLSS